MVKSRIGWIAAASMAAGLVVAGALVAIPLISATENILTGVVLLGFAFGWALLAVLSVRFSDQPQQWCLASARRPPEQTATSAWRALLRLWSSRGA